MRINHSIPHKIILLSAILAFTAGLSVNVKAEDTDTIANGVVVEGIDIGGLTKDEAIAKINEYVATVTGKQAELDVDGNKAVSTIGELGYYWKNEDIVSKAAELCKQGNVIERFKEQEDLAQRGISYDIEYDVNTGIMAENIDNYCSQYNVPHKNASIKREGGSFTYTQESNGRIIDMDATVNQFRDFLLSGWDGNDASLQVTVVDDYPTATVADCQKVTDVLGSFTTHFTTGGSNYNRNQNIANGANLINGTVVYPGETFSANALLEPWTESNGWRMAGTYVNGRTEDSLGGGICQVSTTLYNALLNAELEIVERYNHSMSVGYVPLSQDAALAGTWKDLKFSNNTDAPVYIEAYCSGGSITFNVYGHETRQPGRTVEYISETLGTVQPSEVVTEDPSLPAGYRNVTSSGHVGYTARLLKRVYMNGSLISEEVVNKSTYEASPRHVTVGTGAQQPEPEPQSPDTPEQPSDTQPEPQPAETTTPPETTTKKPEEPTTKKPKDKPADDNKKNEE